MFHTGSGLLVRTSFNREMPGRNLSFVLIFVSGVIPLALSNPGIYLENEKLEIDDDYEIPRDFPDVSISYKIHSEYGRLINLYDWLQVRYIQVL